MKGKKMVVFNFGGALLLSPDRAIALWCEAIRFVGINPNFTIIYNNWTKSFKDEIIPLLAADGNWSSGLVQAVISRSEALFHDTNFNSPANLAEKLLELKVAGYELGIITNRGLDFFQSALSDLGLDNDIFSFVKTGDDGIKKPDPRVFDQVLDVYSAEEIVFIGDSPETDLSAAYSCKNKIDFIAIESSSFPRGLFVSRGVPENFIFKSVIEVIDTLLTLKRFD